jgi:hypothetical protein
MNESKTSKGVPLIMSMMVVAALASLVQVRQVAVPLAFRVIALLLVVPPILLAGLRIVPDARLLSVSAEPAAVSALAEQSALAVSCTGSPVLPQLHCRLSGSSVVDHLAIPTSLNTQRIRA